MSHKLKILTYKLYYPLANSDSIITRLSRDLTNIGGAHIMGFQEIPFISCVILKKKLPLLQNAKIIRTNIGAFNIMTILIPQIELKAVCWDYFVEEQLDANGKVVKDSKGKIIGKREGAFHILVCKYLGRDLLIINCQFPNITESQTEEVIIKNLTRTLSYGVEIPKKLINGQKLKPNMGMDLAFRDIKREKFKKNITHLIKGKKFKTIMLGDFKRGEKLIEGFKPFNTKYSPFFKKLKPEEQKLLNDIQVGHDQTAIPPKSCCLDYDPVLKQFTGQHDNRGDFIMVDKDMTIEVSNHIPDIMNTILDNEYASTHLPVMMEVSFNKSDSIKNSSSTESPEIDIIKNSPSGASDSSVKSKTFDCTQKLFVAPTLGTATVKGKRKGKKKSKKKKKLVKK